MLGDLAIQGDWRHASLFSVTQQLLDGPCFPGDVSLSTILRSVEKVVYSAQIVNSRNPTLTQRVWHGWPQFLTKNNEAAGLRGGGAGNLISPAPGMPKSLFNIFCFYSSKPPRGRIAHKHLISLH